MAERSTLNGRAILLPEIDTICVAAKLIKARARAISTRIVGRGQFLLFDAKITARSGDDRGQIDTGRLPPHKVDL